MIRDQGDRQLDLIGKINTHEIRAIEFYDESNEKIKDLESMINEKFEENQDKNFTFTETVSRKKHDFKKYKNLSGFAKKFDKLL